MNILDSNTDKIIKYLKHQKVLLNMYRWWRDRFTYSDRIRLYFAKIFKKKTILFSQKKDWKIFIRQNIDNFIPFFYKFDKVNLNNFDTILPLSLSDERYINTYPELFKNKVYLSPTNYCIDLCSDKKSFHEFLVKNDFERFVPKINTDLDFPYILKKKNGSWGLDVFIVSNSQDELENLVKIQSDDYFRQEFIPGKEEYATHIIIANNKIVFLKTVEYTFQEKNFIKGKYYRPTSTKEVNHSRFKKLFEDILLAMDYQGICCFNYKIVNDDLVIFEVNPRYCGSMTTFINEALEVYCHYGKIY